MRAEELLKYINNPSLLGKENIAELQKLVHDFPYFQSAHLLLSLASKKWDASVYQQSLKKTAIVVTNRNHLYKLIHNLENVKEAVVIEKEIVEEVKPVVVLEQKNELQILKETEIKVEETKEAVVEVKEIAVEETKKEEAVTEQEIELEIEKSLVNAFVEKEVLKTNEASKKDEPKQEEPGSFGDWIQFLKKNNGQSYSEIEIEVGKEKEKQKEKAAKKEENRKKSKQKRSDIIDKIIESNPGPIRQKEDQKFFKSDFKARESLLENEHLVTETLAKIYAIQGNINKAIRAYEILSLKFPQKSAYFASLIQKLKSNQ